MHTFSRKLKLVLLAAGLLSAPARASELLVLQDAGFEALPGVLKFTCSGFVIGRQGVRVFVSSAHCVKNALQAHKFDVLENPATELAVPGWGAYISSSRTSAIDSARIANDGLSMYGDVLQVPLAADELPETATLQLSTTTPATGEDITIAGFPGFTELTMKCSYQGVTLSYNSVYDKAMLSNKAVCLPGLGGSNMVEGISGGPVRNANGEAIGVVTGFDKRETERTILYYSSLAPFELDNTSKIAPTLPKEVSFTDAVNPFGTERFQMSLTFNVNYEILHATLVSEQKNQTDEMFFKSGLPAITFSKDSKTGALLPSAPLIHIK
jgi:hypothetical protein